MRDRYKMLVNMKLDNSIDIDGDDLLFGVTFLDDLSDILGCGMQISEDSNDKKYDEVKSQFIKASKELAKAFRLLHDKEVTHETN